MSEITFLLSIHHGGRFNNSKKPRYIGGKVTQVCDNLDIDKLSYPEIMSYAKEDLGYDLQSIAGIYYFKVLQGEFILVEDDNRIFEIANRLCSGSQLEFYVDHKTADHVVDETISRDENAINEAAPTNKDSIAEIDLRGEIAVDETIPWAEKMGKETFYNIVDSDFHNYGDWFEGFNYEEEEENDMEDDPPQQTFDNLNVNVDFLTDDDEEELQQSRENVRALRNKNVFNRGRGKNIVAEDSNQNLGQKDATKAAHERMTEATHDSGERVTESEDGGEENDDVVQENEDVVEENEDGEEDDGFETDGEDSTGSFYYDSDDNCSYYIETDQECGDHALRRQSKIVRFDTSALLPIFCCGMVFKNGEECRDALAKKNINPMASSKYLAKHLRERLMSTPSITIKSLKALCRYELKLKISMTQARSVKKKVLEHLSHTYTEEYKRLHDYVHEINNSNPGTTCVVKSSKEEGGEINHFRRFYICFAVCKRGWMAGCRKIIGLDGCFLKGVCKGQLLCAIGRDGNNQMFPIAWAVVAVENKKKWGWFLKMLRHDLCLGNGDELTVMSDMQKGLDSAIREHLPQVEHRMCARHVYAAWAKKWRGEERKLAFWSCARSSFMNELKSNLQKLNLLGDKTVQDLVGYGVESFSKAHFRTSTKCDVVDNNMAESFNGWILEARCKPIISMLEDIRTQVMRRLHIKRRLCSSWICEIAPRPMMKLEKNKEQSYYWEMVWNGDDGYEISHAFEPDSRHIVHLDSEKCTCREWDLTGIPCQHAICALYSEGKDPKNYVCHWYTEGTYLKAYQYMMQPVKGKLLWTETGKEEIAPPPYRKMPGRPKKLRRKAKDEKGVVIKCTICKQPNHNRRKCPNKSKDANPKPEKTGKRKRTETQEQTQEHYENQVPPPINRSQGIEHVSSHGASKMLAKEKAATSNRSQVAKENKTKFKCYGCYVTEKTGCSILNPGTSQRLNWKGKAAMTTRQLQVEAQRKTDAITKQAKSRKGDGVPSAI